MEHQWWPVLEADAGEIGIAQALGVDLETVLEALGGGWQRFDIEDQDGEPTTWFATGKPVQALVGVRGSALVVARPVLTYLLPGGVFASAAEERSFGRDALMESPQEVAQMVGEVAIRRRKSFRWCRTCRTLTPPEHMLGGGECQGCAERYRGILF